VKLTQLGLDLSFDAAVARLGKICAAATTARTRVAIDMESHEYTDRTIEAYRIVRKEFEHPVLALQAYLKRTEADVEALAPLRPAIRLVKGAYDEPKEIAYGPWKTRDAFRRLLQPLLTHTPYTGVGTHDEFLVKEATRFAHRKDIPADRFEFQMLYGVRRDLQDKLRAEGYGVRVYVPFRGGVVPVPHAAAWPSVRPTCGCSSKPSREVDEPFPSRGTTWDRALLGEPRTVFAPWLPVYTFALQVLRPCQDRPQAPCSGFL